ncbi:hypothetical protein Patl1_36549 [Pistacia atlantica]|nr:hypothetical protein Patl1_36549 [Pistacia atlantica]
MQKTEMAQESNLSKFKSEGAEFAGGWTGARVLEAGMLVGANCRTLGVRQQEKNKRQSWEHHFSLLQRETEKHRSDIEKLRSELRYEIDKVKAGQRLDLNLEKGVGVYEMNLPTKKQKPLTSPNKLDKEIHSLRAQVEAAKYDVIKYCIGTLVSISAVGLAIVRILM